jgi:hypothetical protein
MQTDTSLVFIAGDHRANLKLSVEPDALKTAILEFRLNERKQITSSIT